MRRNQPLLGTFVEIWIEEIDKKNPQQNFFYQEICNVVFHEIKKVQDLMSIHNAESEISKLNRLSKADKKFELKIHPWTYEVLLIAKKICEETDGLFDCGIGQYAKHQNNQKWDELGMRSIEFLDTHHIMIQEPIRLDLGGIAKGYAVDRGIEILKNFGIENASINAGGDMRVIGKNHHAVYLRESDIGNAFIYLGDLNDGAIATSSTRFGRTIKKGGMSYLINPRTRKCVEDDLSYSIIAPTCVVADCLTKALAIEKNLHASYFKKFGAIPIIVE
jgi:thiamine biosynthesis lipoprotein